MALQKNTAKAASTLARLRASQASLELRAKQLAARKMDAEGKVDRWMQKARWIVWPRV